MRTRRQDGDITRTARGWVGAELALMDGIFFLFAGAVEKTLLFVERQVTADYLEEIVWKSARLSVTSMHG